MKAAAIMAALRPRRTRIEATLANVSALVVDAAPACLGPRTRFHTPSHSTRRLLAERRVLAEEVAAVVVLHPEMIIAMADEAPREIDRFEGLPSRIGESRPWLKRGVVPE
jgi:hypothetical protein